MNPILKKDYRASERRRNRKGSLMTEAIVSAVILLVGIAIVGKSSYNFRRLWSDTRYYQLATDELCNQMQLLTVLPKEQLVNSIGSLTVSSEISDVLPDAKIVGQLVEDAQGVRIRLAMDWKRVGTGEPLVLIGWHRSTSKSSSSDANSGPAVKQEETPVATAEVQP